MNPALSNNAIESRNNYTQSYTSKDGKRWIITVPSHWVAEDVINWLKYGRWPESTQKNEANR